MVSPFSAMLTGNMVGPIKSTEFTAGIRSAILLAIFTPVHLPILSTVNLSILAPLHLAIGSSIFPKIFTPVITTTAASVTATIVITATIERARAAVQ
jgi:hypothetical protein